MKNMRDRIDVLADLVHLNGDLSNLKKELSQYSWDIEFPVMDITRLDLLTVLKSCINGVISYDKLGNWANLIECRDDLSFENDKMQEIIFELANPEINGNLNKDRLNEIVNELRV
jgi:hypothetical protein